MGAVFQVDLEHPFEQPSPAQAGRLPREGHLGVVGFGGMSSRCLI
jgi:hypothetical protein